jgi:hypothetical protein
MEGSIGLALMGLVLLFSIGWLVVQGIRVTMRTNPRVRVQPLCGPQCHEPAYNLTGWQPQPQIQPARVQEKKHKAIPPARVGQPQPLYTESNPQVQTARIQASVDDLERSVARWQRRNVPAPTPSEPSEVYDVTREFQRLGRSKEHKSK